MVRFGIYKHSELWVFLLSFLKKWFWELASKVWKSFHLKDHLAHINFLLVTLASKHKPIPLEFNPSIWSTAVVLFWYLQFSNTLISLFLEGLKWLVYQYTWGQVDTHSKWFSGFSLAQLKVVDDNLQSQYNMMVTMYRLVKTNAMQWQCWSLTLP